MDIEALIYRVDAFYKQAALLQVPAKLEKQISDWAVGTYCGSLLRIIDEATQTKRPSRNLIFAKAECMKHYKANYTNPQDFIIDLDDLHYFGDKDLAKLGIEHSATVRAEFVFNKERAKEIYGEHNWTGLWTGSLYIHVPPPISHEIITQEKIRNIDREIRQAVRHEMQHMVQTYIENLKDLKGRAGLPSKKISDKDVDERAQGLDQYYKQDREFYTLLTDSIERFKMVVGKLPMSLHNLLLDTWIGRTTYAELEKRFMEEFNRSHNTVSEDQSTEGKLRVMMPQVANSILIGSNLFSHLKRNSPQKYRKAVIEMYKAVQPLL